MPAVTQTPSNIDETAQRFRGAGVATAFRASTSISSGLSLLGHQLKRLKTSKWQGESAWILDGLRFSAIDGLDAQKSLGYANEGEHKADALYVNRASRQAKQALLSSASPMVAAGAFSKNLPPLVTKCNEILGNLQKLIDSERSVDTDGSVERNRARATPKDSSSPTKKGL